MDFCFDAVIIDTSALENFQFDFCGWTTKTLPSFFDFLKEQNIHLLSHPVLDGEIKKHIVHSQLLEKINGLQQNIQRNKEFYKLIGVSPEDAIKRLSELDIDKMLLSEYNNIFCNATIRIMTSRQIWHWNESTIPKANRLKSLSAQRKSSVNTGSAISENSASNGR